MSVEVTLTGRLGNHLFQYAFARIVAEHHGLRFRCVERPFVPLSFAGLPLDSAGSASLVNLQQYFPNAPAFLPGIVIDEPPVIPRGPRGLQTPDLDELLHAPPRHYSFQGIYQRYEYFARHRATLRGWFATPGVKPAVEVHKRDVLLNVRGGLDWAIFNRALPLSYYEEALSGLTDIGRIFVCGVGIDDAFRRRFERLRPTYFEGSAIEQFAFIRSFDRMIIPGSTFSWWAAFLSDASVIFAPDTPPRIMDFECPHFAIALHFDESRYRTIAVNSLMILKCFIPVALAGLNIIERADGRGASLRRSGGPGAPAETGVFDASLVPFLRWMVRQDRPFSPLEMMDQVGPQNAAPEQIGAVVQALVKAGMLTLRLDNLVECEIDDKIRDPLLPRHPRSTP